MPAPPPSSEQPPATTRRRRRASDDEADLEAQPVAQASATAPETPLPSAGEDIAAELSFREAQTALELSLAELQAPDLDVEEMADLYRRASRYAERCEQLLQRVEQEVMQWDPTQPANAALPYQP